MGYGAGMKGVNAPTPTPISKTASCIPELLTAQSQPESQTSLPTV